LEALLFAETLQGTLSPNANPRKGVRWRLTEFDAASTREDSADYSDTSSLVLDLIVIPKEMEFAQAENQKSYRARVGRTLLSAAFEFELEVVFDFETQVKSGGTSTRWQVAVNNNNNGKINSSGQECPLHTSI
jgi:hypothetical protein